MANLTSWIGGTVGFVATAIDRSAIESDYAAAVFVAIGTVKSIGAMGDTSSAIKVSLLAEGRATTVNGELDGGEVPIAVAFDASDTTYESIRALKDTNTNVWFEVTDPDGKIVWMQGLVANWQETERNNTTEKGATWMIRVNTGYTYSA